MHWQCANSWLLSLIQTTQQTNISSAALTSTASVGCGAPADTTVWLSAASFSLATDFLVRPSAPSKSSALINDRRRQVVSLESALLCHFPEIVIRSDAMPLTLPSTINDQRAVSTIDKL